jgi:gluconokinase
VIILLMGVSGAGKTTVGRLLAADLGWTFQEGDDFHSAASVAKMSHGIPLTDEDRLPWLLALRRSIEERLARGEDAVYACSALKRSYRRLLKEREGEPVVFVYLKADSARLAERLEHRAGHFAKRDLLPSQLATLEEPEDALTVDASAPPPAVVAAIREGLGV